MFRVGAQRALLRPLAHGRTATPAQLTQRLARFASAASQSQTPMIVRSLALSTQRASTALVRGYATAPVGTSRSNELESTYRKEVLEVHPEAVSTASSMHPVFGEVGQKEQEDDTDMMAGIRHDVKVIKETFALNTVPKEALNIGLAGVLPYLATSAATVFCAFEMNHASKHGYGWLMSQEYAEGLLHVLEPVQVGYGAVILSCLGTIHWGLEWAGYGGKGGYPRYMIGVLTPAIAWPSTFMPIEYALITQFLAFNLLYAVDSSATNRGWTPPWYSSYRFILTFVVGASIVVSLVGRGQIQDQIGRLPSATDRFRELQKTSAVAQKKKNEDEQEEDEE